MKIPKDIYNVLADKRNFDFIFLKFLKKSSPEDAYDEALMYIRKSAPNFRLYKDYETYRVRHYHLNESKIDIPFEIIKAMSEGIEGLMVKNFKRLKVRKMAYDATVSQLQRYFPNFKPYSNYSSYKSSISVKHKKGIKKI